MFEAAALAAFMTKAVALRAYLSSIAVALAVVEMFASLQIFHYGLVPGGLAWLRWFSDPPAFA